QLHQIGLGQVLCSRRCAELLRPGIAREPTDAWLLPGDFGPRYHHLPGDVLWRRQQQPHRTEPGPEDEATRDRDGGERYHDAKYPDDTRMNTRTAERALAIAAPHGPVVARSLQIGLGCDELIHSRSDAVFTPSLWTPNVAHRRRLIPLRHDECEKM